MCATLNRTKRSFVKVVSQRDTLTNNYLKDNMANPYNSPWLKPIKVFIRDFKLRHKYNEIKKHITSTISVIEINGILTINKNIYVAKNTYKFRIKSHLDWAYYTPKTLADAIDNGTVDSYYQIMLEDVNSDPNIWKDFDFEMELKSFYATRAGRANLI